MRRKVYVPNDWQHTATDAEVYGELVYLTHGQISRTAIRENMTRIEVGLEGSRSDDWLVVGSLSVLTALCAAKFASTHGRLNLLLWDRGRYVPKRVSSV